MVTNTNDSGIRIHSALFSVLDMTKLINFNNLSFSCLASYFCDVCSILLSLCLRLPKVGADRPRLMLTWKQIMIYLG